MMMMGAMDTTGRTVRMAASSVVVVVVVLSQQLSRVVVHHDIGWCVGHLQWCLLSLHCQQHDGTFVTIVDGCCCGGGGIRCALV